MEDLLLLIKCTPLLVSVAPQTKKRRRLLPSRLNQNKLRPPARLPQICKKFLADLPAVLLKWTEKHSPR
jgi:hypothetical protein